MSFLHIDMTQVAEVEILPQVRQRTYPFYIVNIMAADVMSMRSHDINLIKPRKLGSRTLRVKSS